MRIYLGRGGSFGKFFNIFPKKFLTDGAMKKYNVVSRVRLRGTPGWLTQKVRYSLTTIPHLFQKSE